ncbi:hypothetical protein ACNQFZ_05300 [Schinkia sp. CFF1]
MVGYFIDFIIVAALIVGITALNGHITHFIGYRLFGGSRRDLHADQTHQTQVGWKLVGGKK